MKPGAPVMAAREKEVPPVRAEALSKAQDRAGKQEAGKALDALSPEQKRKEKMADTGAAAEARQNDEVRTCPVKNDRLRRPKSDQPLT